MIRTWLSVTVCIQKHSQLRDNPGIFNNFQVCVLLFYFVLFIYFILFFILLDLDLIQICNKLPMKVLPMTNRIGERIKRNDE